MISKIFSLLGWKKKSHAIDEISKSIEEFENRRIYKKLTPQIIESINDDNLVQSVFDNITYTIDSGPATEYESVKKLKPGKIAVFTSWIVEGEVNNGGFNQFYFNSSKKYAGLAVEGFKTMGAVNYASLMEKANNIYNEIKTGLEKYDDGTVEGFSESYENNPLNDLDSEFYELDETDPIGDIMTKYIRDNVEEFI